MSLSKQAKSTPPVFNNTGDLAVPVHRLSLYQDLVRETGSIAAQQNDPSLVILMDSETASIIFSDDELLNKTCRMVVYGECVPPSWKGAANVEIRPRKTPLHGSNRFLILFSDMLSLALFGQQDGPPDGATDPSFAGGWTVQRSAVLHLVKTIMDPDDHDLPLSVPENIAYSDCVSSALMRLTTLQANMLQSRENTITIEKSDLLGVLDILKAISAERKTHEILFVFVKRIARIVHMERCSLVQIFNDESRGHVLVSHEDASFSNYEIDLSKYPELQQVIQSGNKLSIRDVHTHSLTQTHSEYFRTAGISSLLVIPIVKRNKQIGTLLLRAARREGHFSLREISFLEIVTETAANALERAQLLDSIQQANKRLEHLSITDGLTGTYNHRYFHERFKQEFERAVRYRLALSCIMVDVDDFKSVNDTYGHLAGDSVLKEIAARMRSRIRRVDILARVGGEEFVVLLPQTDGQGAAVEAERLRAVVADKAFDDLKQGCTITISAGVATLDNSTMKTCAELLRSADQSLYKAKQLGKNCVVVFEPDNED